MTRTGRHWAIRKVSKGRVKIDKRWYTPAPHHMQHDGRLDGHWFCFGRYDSPYYVSLMGELLDDSGEFKTQGIEVVDGGLPWQWWQEEGMKIW